MEEYLGKTLDIVDSNNDYVFYMELDKIITKPTGLNDITSEIALNEYPAYVDNDLDSYCTLDYVKENINYLREE